MKTHTVFLAVFLTGLFFSSSALTDKVFQSNDYTFSAHTVIDKLVHPWAAEWLEARTENRQNIPAMLMISERNGGLVLFKDNGNNQYTLIKRLSIPTRVFQRGQGGLLDIKKHPEYINNGWVYLTYSVGSHQGASTVLARFKLISQSIKHWQVLYTANAWDDGGYHFGSRIAFDEHHDVYFTIGDRGERDLAQSLTYDQGSVFRLHADGSLPKDNPFVESPAVFSYGHRNPQGLWYDKPNKRLWLHEHGPRGGDELNLVEKGKNYGWPVISYGNEYWSNLPVSDKTHQPGMQQPIHYWKPSIAPSGLMQYSGSEFSQWQGDFFIGSLKFGELVRLRLNKKQTKVSQEERLLNGELGRLRAIYQHQGKLWILIDATNGKLIHLKRR